MTTPQITVGMTPGNFKNNPSWLICVRASSHEQIAVALTRIREHGKKYWEIQDIQKCQGGWQFQIPSRDVLTSSQLLTDVTSILLRLPNFVYGSI